MQLPNQQWMEIIGQAHQNVEFLKDQDLIRTVLNIFQRNTRVASSLGTIFLPQITSIFLDMLNVYIMYSELISKSFSEWGPYVSKHHIDGSVLRDCARNVPDAKESEVLSLFATIVNKYKATMIEDVPHIFEAIFQCTLEVIGYAIQHCCKYSNLLLLCGCGLVFDIC
ncbi:protein EXPORTIN 1A [Trifolium repens]|nr:protein EXPORTIN 1A [Trifolium repens]